MHHSQLPLPLIARAASLVRIVLLQKKRNCSNRVRAWCRPVCVFGVHFPFTMVKEITIISYTYQRKLWMFPFIVKGKCHIYRTCQEPF